MTPGARIVVDVVGTVVVVVGASVVVELDIFKVGGRLDGKAEELVDEVTIVDVVTLLVG